ncbi:MAG: DUF47 family protein [Actinomycetales bacterium]|nr:DUF47 family protein [Actinomycetales bacterium]
MSGSANNPLSKVVGRIFPKVPDFIGMMAEQSALAVKSMDALVAYMEYPTPEAAAAVLDLEKQGDVLKDRNLDALNQAFSTPMDREDLYRGIVTIDHVMNYAKTTVREMQVLGVAPDDVTRDLAVLLKEGTESLNAGYQSLSTSPAAAEPHAQAARKAERNVEKAYRKALAELFDVETEVEHMETMEQHTGPAALKRVMEVFKKREVYRHMSNAADRLARAGEVLRDIVVKLV